MFFSADVAGMAAGERLIISFHYPHSTLSRVRSDFINGSTIPPFPLFLRKWYGTCRRTCFKAHKVVVCATTKSPHGGQCLRKEPAASHQKAIPDHRVSGNSSPTHLPRHTWGSVDSSRLLLKKCDTSFCSPSSLTHCRGFLGRHPQSYSRRLRISTNYEGTFPGPQS